ncbi:hypothetical protein GDO86_020539 [Hymenochirus boettgeri]|uniref:Uncharacterized protein n=1 Tax=Hymenochirus boettgeri TaxID=247094 RepID=A0A8T2IDL9_9PIPI|nr:hypothetical protein GDO86_020539 [Hymenochirus boettgeri]
MSQQFDKFADCHNLVLWTLNIVLCEDNMEDLRAKGIESAPPMSIYIDQCTCKTKHITLTCALLECQPPMRML